MFITIFFNMCFAPTQLPIRVHPMSTWIAYSLLQKDQLSIPKGTRVAPIKIFANDRPEPKLLFNIYKSESPFFKGIRFEIVTIVKQIKDPRKNHFVVLDCLSDTLQWDPKNGIQMPNMRKPYFRTKHNAAKKTHHISCIHNNNKQYFTMVGNLHVSQRINRSFAVDPNYVCLFQDSRNVIRLNFDEKELLQDVQSLDNIQINTNMWKEFRGHMTHTFVHPHKMDFVADVKTIDFSE
jgi:hypothetical protein